ncbi:hypothetical protein Tco_0591422 [Tanacetum coccineum]
MSHFSKSAQSTVKRPYQSKTVLTNKKFTQKVNIAKAQAVNTARPKAVNTVRPKAVNTARPNSAIVNTIRTNQANAIKASISNSFMEDMLPLVEESEEERSLVKYNTASANLRTGSLHINIVSPTVLTTRSNRPQSVSDIFSLRDNVTPEATNADLFGDETKIDMSNLNASYHEEPKRVTKALSDSAWVEAMQEELLQFKLQKVWVLVDLPKGKRAIEGIDYEGEKSLLLLLAELESSQIVLSLCLLPYGIYGFEDPDYPDKVYKVEESTLLLHHSTKSLGSMIGSLMYLTLSRPDIIFSRLISWQCNKKTVVTTSSTEAEYVAAASCCGQDKHIEYLMLNASPLKHVKRGQDTKIPQSSGPPVKVGDEAVHKELGDRMERAATTASSLEAEQESGNINKTQSMATLNEPSP